MTKFILYLLFGKDDPMSNFADLLRHRREAKAAHEYRLELQEELTEVEAKVQWHKAGFEQAGAAVHRLFDLKF